MLWEGGQRGFRVVRRIGDLSRRAQVLTRLVPPDALRQLSSFQRSRLVLLVERIGEYGTTAAQRALRPSERQALRNISAGINRIIGGARTAAAEQAALSRAAQAQMQWVEQVNLRRAGARGIFGTLGVGGTVVVGALAAILLVGLYANARQTSVLESIRAVNAAGGDPGTIVFGSPPPDGEAGDCLQREAADRGLVWSAPDGEPCAGEADCSWRAPVDRPEPYWSQVPDDELAAARARWTAELALFAAPRLEAARDACGIEHPQVATGTIPARIWPVPDEVCGFLPPWLDRETQRPINRTDLGAECVATIHGADGFVRIWAEVVVVDTADALRADSWLSTVSTHSSGRRSDLDIGDRAWLREESDRNIVAGVVGPIGYALYACSFCADSQADSLEGVARFIVDGYLEWADTGT